MQRSYFPRYQILSVSIVLIAFVLVSAGLVHARRQRMTDPPPNQVVVKPKHGIAIGTILSRYNATLLGQVTETNIYFLQLSNGQTADQVLPVLNADSDLYYAEPNYYNDGLPGGGVIMFGAHMAPVAEVIMFGAHGGLTPTPPTGGADQWAWSKIGLADAQKISAGHGIIVAVLDTGLAADHPLVNSSITAGYDFVGMSNSIYDTANGLDDDGDGLVDEDFGHGTHVSGIIVTEAPGVQIMPIRVLNSDGVGTYWEVAAGIRFAVDHGARIINMSLSAPRLTPSLADALNYASAHDVIVVGAAGTDSGPNYPAAYPDPLAVLGVGATDENDAIAWFSGGQAADTDVFAPGVGIYSAFPYNGYALGSGTSMAAPMVSAEAALLLSRYPDWSPTQVMQRIVAKTNPVSGAAAGRINLAAALNTGLAVDYAVGDTGSPNDNNIKPRIRLINNTPENIPLSELKIRYWYTIDSDQPQTFNCDYTSLGCPNLTGSFMRLADGSPNKNATSDTYLEVGFTGAAGSLAGGSQLDMYLRFSKNDWSNYNEANDFSFDAAKAAFAHWDHVTIYRNGVLLWGVEPTGATATGTPVGTASSTATRSATPVPPTLTRTRTSTPPVATYTPTRSSTPVAPTSTFTRTITPTRTNTSLAPTRTSTRVATFTRTVTPMTPSSTASGATSVELQYLAANTGSSSQSIAPQLILFNTGAAGLSLADIKIRYWFTVDGEKPQTYWCDYVALGCGNVTSQFVPVSPPRPGADYYLEIGFGQGAGSLAPGGNTGPIQNRFSKNDWSSYAQTADYSFDPTKTQFADWTKITVYRNGSLVWGSEP